MGEAHEPRSGRPIDATRGVRRSLHTARPPRHRLPDRRYSETAGWREEGIASNILADRLSDRRMGSLTRGHGSRPAGTLQRPNP